MKYIKKGKDTM